MAHREQTAQDGPAQGEAPGRHQRQLDPGDPAVLRLPGSTGVPSRPVDAGSVSTDVFNKVSARAAEELKIPATQLLISATHTHSGAAIVPIRGSEMASPVRSSPRRLKTSRWSSR